jgi:hypothetical protein
MEAEQMTAPKSSVIMPCNTTLAAGFNRSIAVEAHVKSTLIDVALALAGDERSLESFDRKLQGRWSIM